MTDRSRIRVELWDTYEAAAGVRRAYLTPVIAGGGNLATRSVDGDDTLEVSVLAIPELVNAAGAGVDLVVRVDDPVQGITEWRVAQSTDTVGPGEGLITLRGRSVITELTDCGPVWEEDTSGTRRYNLGTLVELTPQQVWDEIIQPFLTATGRQFITRGTFGVTDLLTFECNRLTPRAILNLMAAETGAEFRLRRHALGVNLQLDFVPRLGANATVVRAEVGRNLRAIEQTGERQDYANTIVAHGDVPEGDTEPATIEDNVWEVYDVDGEEVYLRDPETHENPVTFEGQFARGGGTDDGPLYLERREAPGVAGSVSFVAAATTANNSVSTTTLNLPTHQAGDILVAFGFREFGSVPQITGTGSAAFVSLASQTQTGAASAVFVALATSSSMTAPLASSQSGFIVLSYRGTRSGGGVGTPAVRVGAVSTATIPALSMRDASGASWVGILAAQKTFLLGIEVPPAGFTNRADFGSGNSRLAAHDSAAGVTSFAGATVALPDANEWAAYALEILAPREALTRRVLKGRAPAGGIPYVEMPNASHGLQTGDLVSIRRTSASSPISELEAGDRLIGRPRVVGDLSLPGQRGERNWVRNARGAGITSGPTVYRGFNSTDGAVWIWEQDATHLPTGWTKAMTGSPNTATYSVTNLPPALVIKAGWVFKNRLNNHLRITQDVTVDGSGNATLTHEAAVGGTPRWDVPVIRYNAPEGRAVTSGNPTATGNWRDDSAGSSSAGTISVTGFPPGTVFQWPDTIQVQSTALRGTILNSGVVDGSGNATIRYTMNGGTASSYFTSTVVEIVPAEIELDAATGYAVGVPGVQLISGPPAAPSPLGTIRTPVVNVRGGAGSIIWASVPVQYWTPKLTVSGLNAAVSIIDATGPVESVIGWVWDALPSMEVQERIVRTMKAEAEIVGDRDLCVAFHPPGTNVDHRIAAFPGRISLTIGPDDSVPFTGSSFANRMLITGSRVLDRLSRDRIGYVVRFRDLAYFDEYTMEDERLTLGGAIRLVSRERGIDTEARVVQITTDLLDPGNSEIVLDTRPPKLTRLLAGLP
jgi:hypothetical protein